MIQPPDIKTESGMSEMETIMDDLKCLIRTKTDDIENIYIQITSIRLSHNIPNIGQLIMKAFLEIPLPKKKNIQDLPKNT